MLRISIIGLLFLVTACAGVDREKLSWQARVYEARGDFNIALNTFNTYAQQEFCSETMVIACAEPEIVIEGHETFEEADKILDEAQRLSAFQDPEQLLLEVRMLTTRVLNKIAAKELKDSQ